MRGYQKYHKKGYDFEVLIYEGLESYYFKTLAEAEAFAARNSERHTVFIFTPDALGRIPEDARPIGRY